MSISTEIANDVAWITMDDGKANAVSHDLLAALNAALDEAEAKAKAVVIAGRPGRFSAGFDLKVMQAGTPEDVVALVRKGGELALRVFTFPMPVVAACTGHALAMGALLLLSCDTRIGVKGDFKLGLNETAIGMALPDFGLELPRARLHPHHLTQAVIQARVYDPEGAVEAGYLDGVVEDAALRDTAGRIAAEFATLPTQAYAANKMGIRAPVIEALKAGLA